MSVTQSISVKPHLQDDRIAFQIVVLAYLLVEFIPAGSFPIMDVKGFQWLYLACINILTIVLLLVKGKLSFNVLDNKLTYAYLSFCGFALLSLIFASNPVEWLVSYSRLLITVVAFFNLTILFYSDNRILRSAILLLATAGVIQSLKVIYDFSAGAKVIDITFNLGNKNILAASIMIKLALTLFLVNSPARVLRWGLIICIAFMAAAIYMLSARSSIIGMVLLLVLYSVIAVVNKRKAFVPVFITIIVFIAVTMQMQQLSKTARNSYKGESVTARILSVKDDITANKNQFSRLTIWHNTINLFGTHPLSGGGYGNWKINCIPYEKKIFGNNFISRHAHNDFLEIAADTGFMGALAYVSLFFICGWFLWRIIRSGSVSGSDLQYAAPFVGMVAYMVDAFFNFPLERANMQMLFATVMALNVANYSHFFSQNIAVKKNRSFFRPAIFVLLLLSSAALFVSWRVFESMKGEYIANKDLAEDNTMPHHSFDEISRYFHGIPNITETVVPIAHIKARYLIDEHRYDEAFTALSDDKGANPYSDTKYHLLAELYEKRGKLDSAYRNYKQAYELNPGNYWLYADMQKICMRRKDSIGLEQNFRKYAKYNSSPKIWTDASSWSMQTTGNVQGALKYLYEGSRAFPADTGIIFNIHYLSAYDYNRTGAFSKSVEEGLSALQIRDSYPVVQNLGLAYFGIRDYAKALYYFDLAAKKYGPMNGESIYFRGECYMILGDKLKACADFAVAKKYNYPVEDNLLQLCK